MHVDVLYMHVWLYICAAYTYMMRIQPLGNTEGALGTEGASVILLGGCA